MIRIRADPALRTLNASLLSMPQCDYKTTTLPSLWLKKAASITRNTSTHCSGFTSSLSVSPVINASYRLSYRRK